MKRDRALFIGSILFYSFFGLAACMVLLFADTPANSGTSYASLYDINPELAEVSRDTGLSAEPTVPAEPAPEAEETEPDVLEPEVIRYSFVTTNRHQVLHLREAPSLDARILHRLPPQSTGEVLEPGESWSLIQCGDLVGYASNQYLEFQEIP